MSKPRLLITRRVFPEVVDALRAVYEVRTNDDDGFWTPEQTREKAAGCDALYVVATDRVVSGMEEAFALVRAERGALPRAVNMISGPSRTGDIEQTIVLGAHGPFRVHILVVG